MGFKIDPPENKPFVIVPAGTYAGRLIQLIDLGWHDNTFNPGFHQRKVRLIFELNEPMEDGRPFQIGQEYTLSLHEKANFRHLLESWRGRAFEEDELENVEIEKFLGVVGLVSVIHAKTKAGKDFAKISSISKLPKGMEMPAVVNKIFMFDTTAPDMKIFDEFPDWLKAKIHLKHPLTMGKKESNDFPYDDDAPF